MVFPLRTDAKNTDMKSAKHFKLYILKYEVIKSSYEGTYKSIYRSVFSSKAVPVFVKRFGFMHETFSLDNMLEFEPESHLITEFQVASSLA